MGYYDSYLNHLKEELIIAFNSFLGFPLKNKEFKDGHYSRFEAHIENALANQPNIVGVGVSKSKLKELIKYGFEVDVPLGQAKENTLDKATIFLGYENWKHFIECKDEEAKQKAETRLGRIKDDFMKAKQEEIAIKGMLPVIDREIIRNHFVQGGSYYRGLLKLLFGSKSRRIKYATSGKKYVAESFVIVEATADTALILVQEFDDNYAVHMRNRDRKAGLNASSLKESDGPRYVLYELCFRINKWKILSRYETTFGTQWLFFDDPDIPQPL